MKRLNALLIVIMIVGITWSCGNSDDSHSKVSVESPSINIEFLQNEMLKYPDSLLIAEQLIMAYRNNQDFDSAINLTDDLIKKDSSNAYLLNMAATLYYENGDTSQAIKYLEKAISIYPVADYYLALASIYARQQNPKAITISDLLLSHEDIGANKSDVYFVKGLYYNFKKEPERAISVLDSALSLNFSNMNAYREKAIAYMKLNDYKKAVQVLKRATTLSNSFDEGYYWMGKAYEKLGRPDSAILSYQTALLYDKNYTEARSALDSLQKKKK